MRTLTLDALPPRPGASDTEKADQREGALEFLAALSPRDPIQAMLATHIVGSHFMAMEYLRRAARHELPPDLHLRTVGKAVELCRIIVRSMLDLAQRQGTIGIRRPAPPATVRPQPTPPAAQPTTPAQPPVPENRHERRQRERAERHLAALQRHTGHATTAPENAFQQRLRAEIAALTAATADALAG